MTKETNIIFVYDTELLKREEDDPNSAILYFYPTWVSEQQKTALCGQLMGTVLCVRGIFAMPKTICLQSGKFGLVRNGRFILVIGTDRNIPDWILEHRTNLFYSLINFFHNDFHTLAQLYSDEQFRQKLYHIFDTYLKLLFLSGCIFNHIPLFDLPKTENDIIKNIRVFLDKCYKITGVFGGMLSYHNKIVHTQLSIETSKKIIFSDPFRIKNPAEISDLNFELPHCVKLLQAYIPMKEFDDFQCEWTKNCLSGVDFTDAKTENFHFKSPNRDSSFIFTTVPEDSTLPPPKIEGKKSRPNSLNLNSLNLDLGNGLKTPLSEVKPFVMECEAVKHDDIWSISRNFHKCEKLANPFLKHERNERLIRKAIQRSNSEPNLNKSISDSNQYSNSSKKSHSIHDPFYPRTNEEKIMSQYYKVECMQNERTFKDDKFKELISDRKKSLSLPIKPHNASEAQKGDLRSPVGYCTPLMNKLALPNFDRPTSSKDIPYAAFVKTEESKKTEETLARKRCILFLYGEHDVVVSILQNENCLYNGGLVKKLYQLCAEVVPMLEVQLRQFIDPSKANFISDSDSCSILSMDSEWGTKKHGGLWDGPDLVDLSKMHGDFMEDTELVEVYLRQPNSVLFARQDRSSEFFYKETAPQSSGLITSNDALASIHQTALGKLDKIQESVIK